MDFILPNDSHGVVWSLMIVVYPYVSGIAAGAFLGAIMYYVFGREELEPIAPFALAMSFSFLLFAPVPLLLHLGQPQRAFNIMITPNFSSAMAGFGFIYLAFVVIVALMIWLVFRPRFIERAERGGVLGLVSRLILLGNVHQSPATREGDRRLIKLLGGLSLPLLALLPGYVGFLFGSIKANPWWSSSMMFVIFIVSAFVSGIALLVLHYLVVAKLNKAEIDDKAVRALSRFLWGLMAIAVALELLELLSIIYERTEEGEILLVLVEERLVVTYVLLQFVVFSLGPFVLLGIANLARLGKRMAYTLIGVSAAMLLVQVLLMRWNIVVGGQVLSKSMRGFVGYTPEFGGREGVLAALAVLLAPFVVMWAIHKLVSVFPKLRADKPAKSSGAADG